MVPHLVTALTDSINELEQRVLDSMSAVERWFRLEWMEHTPGFYSAIDIRNAGFKLAPVGTNLFPSEWNQLTPEMLPLLTQAAMASIEKICPEARNLLVIPKNGPHSARYLENLVHLMHIFSMAGLNVRLGSIDPALKKTAQLKAPSGPELTLEPVLRNRRRLILKDFDPCAILLNNDLSAGAPGILEEIFEQYLLPPLHAAWPIRRRSNHCRAYEEVSKRMGKLLGIDPWLINPLFEKCDSVDLGQDSGLDGLRSQVDQLLTRVRRKYKEYGIKESPFAVIKADYGDFELGVVSVRDAKEVQVLSESIQTLAAKSRKTPLAAHSFLIQEGVKTQEVLNQACAEPVVYTMDRYVVGGFYRTHAERDVHQPLNIPGAQYVPLTFGHGPALPQLGINPGASAPNRFYMYGVIARLALLASSYELEATDPQAEGY